MQDAADLLDAEVHSLVEIDVGVRAPELLPNLLPGDQLARSGDEKDEQPKRLWLQPQSSAITAELAGLFVELERAETEHFLSLSLLRLSLLI